MKFAKIILLSLIVSCLACAFATSLSAGPDAMQKVTLAESEAALSAGQSTNPLLVFGLMADIHYADKPNGGRNDIRRFRSSLQRLKECVLDLNKREATFAIQLGDIVDSDKNYPGPQRSNLTAAMQHDLQAVMDVTREMKMPLYHVIGNHCVDAGPEFLRQSLNMESFYYDFTSPSVKGWRFVVTNGMDPRRFISSSQMAWFRATLQKALENNERVICFNHYSLLKEASPNHDILQNSQPLLDIIEKTGNVAVWFSGHDHGGGYAFKNGTHYFTVPAMVESPVDNAYAMVELYTDKIIINGIGKVPGRTLSLATAKKEVSGNPQADIQFPIVDTGQIRCYNNTTEIVYPQKDTAFYGQDAQYNGNQPSYKDNGDGTVTDLNTGLMWTQNPGSKKTFEQAVAGASECKVVGHTDWRLPTIKELYSLILFSGSDPDPMSAGTSSERPFIDTTYFKFKYGDPKEGDRVIDSQFATSTIYRSTTMKGDKTVFGVNFADGRIKGYGTSTPRGEKTFYVLYVRGNTDYGKNKFVDNGNGTLTDKATGLTWMKVDSGVLNKTIRNGAMNWGQALKWADSLEYAGHSDWRLPTAKELQSIVDYSRCPDVTDSAAIDPLFDVTVIKNEASQKDYPCYWTSTSHCKLNGAQSAAYICFGRGLGYMQDRRTSSKELMDVHGAGSQRSDPKSGNPADMAGGRGPQGDVVRIYNYVRCVRGGIAEHRTTGPAIEMKASSRQQRPNIRGNEQGGPMMGPGQQGGPMRGPGQQGGPMSSSRGGSGGDFIVRLDKNGDGKVSSSEFDGPAEHFRQFDKNNDGYLSEDEASLGLPQGQNSMNNRQDR